MHLFYEPDITSNNGFLNEDESKHCIKVLRHKVGDHICIMDGKGSICTGELISAHQKKCQVKLIEQKFEEPKNYNIHIAVAPTKNIDRMEWFLEKATEIGIDQITPIITEHSERKTIKIERLEKIIISAMKQSLKSYKPILNPIIRFEDFLNNSVNKDQLNFIAHCYESPKMLLKNTYKANENTLVLIGPEGDFSENEVNIAINKDFTPISLGNARLRTETAALMACATANIINL